MCIWYTIADCSAKPLSVSVFFFIFTPQFPCLFAVRRRPLDATGNQQRVRRNDSDGLWHTTPSPLPPPPQPTPASMEGKQYLPGMSTVDGNAGGEYGAGSSGGERIPPLGNASSVAASVSSSLVMVSFDIPHLVSQRRLYKGCSIEHPSVSPWCRFKRVLGMVLPTFGYVEKSYSNHTKVG